MEVSLGSNIFKVASHLDSGGINELHTYNTLLRVIIRTSYIFVFEPCLTTRISNFVFLTLQGRVQKGKKLNFPSFHAPGPLKDGNISMVASKYSIFKPFLVKKEKINKQKMEIGPTPPCHGKFCCCCCFFSTLSLSPRNILS